MNETVIGVPSVATRAANKPERSPSDGVPRTCRSFSGSFAGRFQTRKERHESENFIDRLVDHRCGRTCDHVTGRTGPVGRLGTCSGGCHRQCEHAQWSEHPGDTWCQRRAHSRIAFLGSRFERGSVPRRSCRTWSSHGRSLACGPSRAFVPWFDNRPAWLAGRAATRLARWPAGRTVVWRISPRMASRLASWLLASRRSCGPDHRRHHRCIEGGLQRPLGAL